MGNDYQLPAGELRSHSDRLTGVRDDLGSALEAAQRVSLSREAYGQVSVVFPVMVDIVSTIGIAALRQAVDAVGRTITEVRATAAHADAVDDTTAEDIRRVRR
jgi:hypothetical protein